MKKVKMDTWDFFRFLENFKLSYYDFKRTKIVTKDGRTVYGTLYTISETLSDGVKAELIKWKNISLFISQCEYAPEIKHNTVFLGDKCITA